MYASCQYHISSWADVETESDTESLPDRMINPGEYEPMVPTAEEHIAADPQKTWGSEELMRRLIPVSTYDGFDVFSD